MGIEEEADKRHFVVVGGVHHLKEGVAQALAIGKPKF